ncbi:S-layer homology domain-containing protein [Lentibacillus sp. Marseille-P4043]|uniref:S-layer homology domain-containing protein n=1 Tax=Lentibacillus sp. Marseille-P4043 TaxID=2040293 RepID=UPI000D0BDC06|nr:S-layer homology domain-containing protein [Lentibacillus sp. Marseille-P4043]
MRHNKFLLGIAIIAFFIMGAQTTYAAQESINLDSAITEGDVSDPATQIPVLMYHGLLKKAENKMYLNNSSIISVENFKEQMQYLADNGYHTVTAAEMNDFLAGEIQLPRKSVMIQFDDGLRSVYRYAYPIMKEHGLHGIANIITGRTDKDYGVDWDPDRNQYMNQEMLDTISPVFDMQSHTNQMHFLSNGTSGFMLKSPENAFQDLRTSRDKLAKYGDVLIFAYPFGQYNADRKELVKKAGFSMAYTIKKGYIKSWDDPYQLNRNGITPKTSLQEFKALVSKTVSPIFKDIPLNHPNFDQTFWLYSHHIVKGYPDGHFGPRENINRAQAAKMLVQALGLQVPDHVEAAPFSDIPVNYGDPYLVKAVTALKAAGIFNGDDGKFRPASVLTREQMATVLVNTFKWEAVDDAVVKDLGKASESHQVNIKILAQKCITVLPNGYFSPHDPTRRLHLASFLYKSMHLE